MSWLGLEGHDEIVERFRRMVRAGRLSSTFLLVGPPGIGKFSFAQRLAQSLFCERHAPEDLLACGECPSCQQVLAETHPDFEVVRRPADRASIPIDLLIGDREHRMREGLISRISMRPLMGGRKIAILDDADYLNEEGANSLLKTLEEPPLGSLILLIGSSEQRQLPTIRSRSQIIRFQPLSREVLASLFARQGAVVAADRLDEVQQLVFGSFSEALALADDDQSEYRRKLWQELDAPRPAWSQVSDLLTEYLNLAGKETAARRPWLARAIQWVALYYRQQLRAGVEVGAGQWGASGEPGSAAEPLSSPTQREKAADRIERCIEALQQLDASANLPTLVECWLDDLR